MESLGSILIIVVMFVALYFFMIRPQKKQEKQIKEMRDSLQVGAQYFLLSGNNGRRPCSDIRHGSRTTVICM